MQERRFRPSIVGPLILIAAGILLLLNQMGRLPWSVWWTLWRFWPVVLILIGVEILVGISRSTVLYVVGLLIAIVVLGTVIGYAILRGGQEVGPAPVTGTETVSQTLQDSDRGRVTLVFGAGTLEIGALADSPNLVEGIIEYTRYSQQAEQGFGVRNGRAEFSLRARSQGITSWAPGDTRGEHWNLKLTPRIPLEIDVNTGVGDANLDLSRLKVTQLQVKTGVGRTTLTLPAAAGITKASVEAGIGEITVYIPNGVGARIHVSKALGSANVDGQRFTSSGDEYTSRDYQTADNKVELDISTAIGTINIR